MAEEYGSVALLAFLAEDSAAAMFEEHAMIEGKRDLTLCKRMGA
jgi:hypothetical protein